MKKISTVFVINRETNLATTEILKGNEWVANGEGIATVKFDGSSCLIKDGILFRRWNRKLNKKALRNKSFAAKNCLEFIPDESMFRPVPDGTFEICGPKIRCNPHNFDSHVLLKHGDVVVEVEDRSFEGILTFLENFVGEGLVFHHPDGRMVKVRMKDFDLKWNEDANPRDKR